MSSQQQQKIGLQFTHNKKNSYTAEIAQNKTQIRTYVKFFVYWGQDIAFNSTIHREKCS